MARALTDNLLHHIISKFKQLQGTNQLVLAGCIYQKFYSKLLNSTPYQTH
jgi:hypothetical protein